MTERNEHKQIQQTKRTTILYSNSFYHSSRQSEQPLQSEESAAYRQQKQRMLPPSTSYSNQLEVGLSCAIYSKAYIADIEFNTPLRSIATHNAAEIPDA